MLLCLQASLGLDVAETIDLINSTYGDDPDVRNAISGLVHAIEQGKSQIEVDNVVYRGSS